MKSIRFAKPFAFVVMMVSSGSLARADSAAEKEAEEYMQAWEDRGREACKDNERGCAAAGHALDRAADAYENAGKLDKAITIRKMILDPRWHLDYTDYGRIAAFTLARNYQSIAEYGEAALIIETAAKRFSKTDEAPDALMEAATLRLEMGEIDQAVEDLNLFAKNYARQRSSDIPKMVAAIGTKFWDYGRAKEALEFVEKWIPSVDRNGNLHDRILAHALLGRLHAHARVLPKAAAEYQIVLDAWKRPEDGIKSLDALGGSSDEKMKRLGQTLTAIGEATFFFAEQKRAEVDAIGFPEYTGPGNKDSVLAFVSAKVSPWLQKKLAAIEAADQEYQKILQIQPVPPPRWVIAAAGRVGFLWANFVEDFHRAPMPKEWNSKEPIPGTSMPGTEIKKLYLQQISSLSEPLLFRAKNAFRVCVDKSVKFQWHDEHSQACTIWLEKNFRKEFVPIDELRPLPTLLSLPISTAVITPP